jgi:peptidoglycan/LPS O-acetylase OafA/YrhL
LLGFLPYWWIGAAMVMPRARKTLERWFPVLVLAWVFLTVFSHLEQTAVTAELRKATLAGLVALLIVALEEAPIPSNPLSYIGKAGYSIYVLHAPLCVFLLMWGVPWWGVLSSAVAVGVLCYLAFERPIDRVGRRLALGAANVGPRRADVAL